MKNLLPRMRICAVNGRQVSMAGTTELMKRLHSDGEPFAKRLCLAQNVFQSMQLPIARKEESVTNWLCQVAAKFKPHGKRKSVSNSSDDFVKLWSTLHSCVANPRFNVADIRPSTRAYIIEVLSKQLERKDLPESEALVVLECASTVFKNKGFQTYFCSNPSQYVEFANVLLSSLSNKCVEDTSLIPVTLTHFGNLVPRIKSKHDIHPIFIEKMLLTITALLKSDIGSSAQSNKPCHRCVMQVLFPPASPEFFEFLGFLDNIFIKSAPSEKEFSLPTKLIAFLEETRDSLEEDSYMVLLNMIFRTWSMASTSHHSHTFSMFVLISYLAGFEIENQKCGVKYEKLKEICEKGELTSRSLILVGNMIQCLSKVDMHASIKDTSFNVWLTMLIESIFTTPSSFDVVSLLKLMSSLIAFNPFMAEKHVKNVFGVIMAKPLPEDLKLVYANFLSDVLALYSKLSRVPAFFKFFMESLQEGVKKQEDSGILSPSQAMWLPPAFIEQLVEVATVMPSTASIAVLNFLIHQFQTFIKSDENSQTPLQSSHKNLLIQTVCGLMSAIFRGIRMLELSTITSTRSELCGIMKRLSNLLGSFGKFLLDGSQENGQAISSFLNVAYHWAAEAILIEQYADAGRKELLESVGTDLKKEFECPSDCGILSYLHPYLDTTEWKCIYDKVISLEDQECMSLLLKLDLQLLSALRMFNSAQSNLPKVVAKRACAMMIQRHTHEYALSIDQNSVSNVILMAPLLDVSELSSLGDCLIANVVACENDNSLEDLITILTEEKLIACGLVCSVFNSLRRVVKTLKRKKDESGGKLWKTAKSVIGKLDVEVVIENEIKGRTTCDKLSSVLSSMATPLFEALSALNGCQRQLAVEESDLANILRHLRILRSLPLCHFSTGFQDVVFLSLLSVAVDCSPLGSSQTKDNILSDIFDHLLLGLFEKTEHKGRNLKVDIDHGALIGGLAYFVVHHNVGSRLLEQLMGQALHQEQSQEQILDRVADVIKEGKEQVPSKENMLLGTVFLQVSLEMKSKLMSPLESSADPDKSSSNLQNKIKKTSQKIAKAFESLIKKQLVTTEEGLEAFALFLNFKLSFKKDIGNLLPELDRFCQCAVSSLHSSRLTDVKAAESFILTVCRHRKNPTMVFPESLIKDVWYQLILSEKPKDAVVKGIIKAATDDELLFIISDLLSRTQHPKLENEKSLSTIVHIWSMLLREKTFSKVHEKSQNALRALFGLQQLGKVSLQELLGFLNDMLLSQKGKLDMQSVDLCFLILHDIQLPQTCQEFLPAAKQFLSVLSAIFLDNFTLALDSVPSFLQMLQHFVKQLANASVQRPELSRSESAELAGVAFEAEKLVTSFTKPDLKRSLRRVAAYFMADLIAIFETTTLCSSVKKHFENMVYALMSILDDHAMRFLLRVMSLSSTQIFKDFNHSFKKFHSYKGEF